jgi:choline dehydrogenase-like flavoprotein
MPFPYTTPPTITRRRTWLQVLAVSALLPVSHASQAEVALSTAMNRAGRFRALSQRCAKAYCQLYLDVLPDNARQVLATAQGLVQRGFDDLSKARLSTDAAQQISLLHLEATALNGLLATPVRKEAVAAVSARADTMLAAANKTSQLLEAQSQRGSAQLVNQSGRQRMLSQRLAKNYFLAAAGLHTPQLQEQLGQDRMEFTKNMETLAAAPISNNSIRNELTLCAAQWTFFESAIHHPPSPEALKTVATTSERLLEVANNLTQLYDAALKDVLGTL